MKPRKNNRLSYPHAFNRLSGACAPLAARTGLSAAIRGLRLPVPAAKLPLCPSPSPRRPLISASIPRAFENRRPYSFMRKPLPSTREIKVSECEEGDALPQARQAPAEGRQAVSPPVGGLTGLGGRRRPPQAVGTPKTQKVRELNRVRSESRQETD